ncbi:histidine kinase [Sulfuriferula plumbiphila]|uniref:Histidine kinase n=1 Tax=Sulfuriferula plumbiphila TaxID=171865 RepID=A0A512LC17_9PROT|nr:HDOD domain-containing protein [Sulfuriferula plumbiphila]BBP04096.1 histidine kinase [Sulfuriferula plumbiphila]GEP32034.1 histidine kinase [Sulfuriferula plumbiphila]
MRNDIIQNACDNALVVNTAASDWHGVATHVLAVETQGLPSRQDEIRERLLAQHGIYDRDGQIRATELTLRIKLAYSHGQPCVPELRNAEDETLLAGLYSLVEEGSLKTRILFASVSADTLMSPEIEYLPQQNVVFAVHAEVDDVPTLLPRIKHLIECGYRVVLDETGSDEALQPLVAATQAVRVDASRYDAIHLDSMLRSLRAMGARQLIAAHIRNAETLEVSRQLGFDLFQGAFVTQTGGKAGVDVPVNRLRVLELIDRVMAHTDMAEVEALLKMDAVLSYRLLRFANSAGCGVVHEVTSISQVLQQMGHGALYRWLTLLLHVSGKSGSTGQAVLKRALTRACFMQALAGKSLQPVNGDELYLTGLFSVLGEMLNMPMQDAVASLNLGSAIKQALVSGSGTHAGFLELALACEENNETRIANGSAQCMVTYIDVNIALINALISAEEAAL